MSSRSITSREFNQDTSKAKREAHKGPVFITDRGRASHVLLTIEAYQTLTGQQASVVELLAMPDAGTVEFEPSHIEGPLTHPADLS